jgi:hypothetical protein
MSAQTFAQLNQAEGHHTHDRNGGKQPLHTLQLQPFRTKACLDRLVIFLSGKGLARYLGRGPARFQPLPIG